MTATLTTGIRPDMPEADYHADRDSLSVSGMKLLLQAPALFRHRQDNPEYKAVFDFGSAAHKKVLGVGSEVVVHHYDPAKVKSPKSTNAWKEDLTAARAEGKVLLLPEDAARIDAMALQLEAKPEAMRLMTAGQAEVSAFWHDDRYGVTRRARADWLREDGGIVDYKTARDVNPKWLPKTVTDFGYHMQHAQYVDVFRGAGIEVPFFAFIFQEKEPPHMVTVARLDPDFVAAGRARCRAALERFRDCREADVWPDYTPGGVVTLDPPHWMREDY